MKYLVRLDVDVGIYVDVDVTNKRLASDAAKKALASDDVKKLVVQMVGSQSLFEYDYTVGSPHCTKILDLGDDGKIKGEQLPPRYIPSKFLREDLN